MQLHHKLRELGKAMKEADDGTWPTRKTIFKKHELECESKVIINFERNQLLSMALRMGFLFVLRKMARA
jgi:hypothetical protein